LLILCSFSASPEALDYDFSMTADGSDSYFEHSESITAEEALDKLQSIQSEFGEVLDSFVDSLDKWLSGSDKQVARKKSRFIFYLPTRIEGRSIKTDLKVRAIADLARSSKLWQISLSSFDETSIDSPDERTPGAKSKEIEEGDKNQRPSSTEATISLGRTVSRAPGTELNFNVGLKFSGITKPNPYTRLRWRKQQLIKEDVISRKTHNLVLERIQGLFLESRQTFDIPINIKHLFRSQTTGVWYRNQKNYQINQRFIYYDKIYRHRSFAYFLDGNWTLDPGDSGMDDYAIGVNWREKLYKDWLYAELEPRFTWRDDDNFHQANFGLMFMMEMHFYK